MLPLRIDAVRPQDIDPLLEMVRALARHHGDAAQITRAALERDVLGPAPWLRVLLARYDSVVGYAALVPLAQLQFGVRGMDMHHLYVVPQARGQGVARALIDASVALAREAGCRYMTVGTHPGNAPAAAVYRAMGFDDLPPPGPRFRIRW
ncbi:GNAT family N-acetyltransferase [Sulfitobacter sp. HNIBRBA3233]|uniref:GNAT family N-acetyltransferase n=1 Tax=Sulfitobacter marinivivus TaxID=3158558 RepID=UPI0032DF34B4